VHGAENRARNGAKRNGAPSTTNAAPKQRKTGRGPNSSKRRESVQSTASSTNAESCPDTIAGRVKYSELARDNDWVDQELIDAIERDIVDHGEKVSFEDIAGLEHTKQLLQETVMLPQIAPHLFTVRLATSLALNLLVWRVVLSTVTLRAGWPSETMQRCAHVWASRDRKNAASEGK
jgi:hypothetical protein